MIILKLNGESNKVVYLSNIELTLKELGRVIKMARKDYNNKFKQEDKIYIIQYNENTDEFYFQ